MIKTAIVAIFVLFHHNGSVAVASKVNSWNLEDCNTFAKTDAKDYEGIHKGDRVVAYCVRIFERGI